MTCYGGIIWFWWCQVTLIFVTYIVTLASCPLVISSATCPHYIWLEPLPPVILVCINSSESLRSCDSWILRSWDPGYFKSPGSQTDSGILWSWCDQAPETLWSCDPVHVIAPGSWASFVCCGTGCRASAQGLLRALAQTGRYQYHWLVRVPASLHCIGPNYSQMLGIMLCPPYLWSYVPVCVRAPGNPASFGFCGIGCRASAQGLLRVQAQTGRVVCGLMKWFLMIVCYTHRLVPCSVVIRETSFNHWWKQTNTHTQTLGRTQGILWKI